MIVTQMKPFDIIKNNLMKGDKICLVSCNTCARKCETGGKEVMDELAARLKSDGYNVIGETLVGMPCGLKHLDEVILQGDTAVVLGCDASVKAISTLFPEVKVIPALDTVGLGAWDENGKVTIVRKFD